ncbi:MAG TPA: DUF87 domain-containing protein, partial [Micromonosporaceae bacterium]|nr:DUF87 domain-containing protein [Micromonosporaceae bacterium]
RELSTLHRIPTPEIGEAIVAKHLAQHYAEAGFTPPYPTWPVLPSAFADAPDYTPRALLKRVERHIRSCVAGAKVGELIRLNDDAPGPQTVEVRDIPSAQGDRLAALDARFEALRGSAEVDKPLDPGWEDQLMPALLRAALRAWVVENAASGRQYKIDPPPSAKPALHARLRLVLDEATEDESHWAFRAIASTSAMAVISRIRTASTMAGLDPAAPGRRLVLLRRTSWGLGPRTKEVVAAFEAAGGRTASISDDDLATFDALRILDGDADPAFEAWLVSRRPASSSDLLRDLRVGEVAAEPRPPRPRPDPDRPTAPPRHATPSYADTFPLGELDGTGQPLMLSLESLRMHTAIFAGSGSGKTVLIRRLVEECALRGVSSIVLDPNNDLARLGDAWPYPPGGWAAGDGDLAAEYFESVDVLVWTPRRQAGRPLAFQPLPDFAPVRDDPDEFRMAIDAAVAALAPRALVESATAKAQKSRAVLSEALSYFGRRGGGGNLRAFVDLLADLPDGVSTLNNATRIAADIAETLKSAMVNDPLFGGAGTPVDPGELLTPPPGKRARVSVISFAGLASDEQRQGFVNQLQMALFAWIKRNPAGDRPLGGLLVMDEAQTLAPSGAMTACTESTLALVQQARKYGLGLVFATQAPRGLHNRIPGNAATQFYGRLSANAQIAAAREIASAKGGAVPEIGLLRAGQFYAATEGHPFERVRSPMCLSHHPRSPLTQDEVIARAGGVPAEAPAYR